jgi:hypothetical protein
MRHMGPTAVAQVRWVAAVALLCLLGACNTEDGRSTDGPTPSSSDAQPGEQGGTKPGSTSQGEGSGNEVGQLQGGAESAAGQVASGDGLRVENKTGGPVALIFPDGDTSWVAAGKVVVVLRPCGDRLPLRAESKTGEFIAERDGRCRPRDTWVLN